MSDRKPYSRVYWEILDDTKFDAIRADMRHFGSWTLMLVLADMAYPAPTFVPPTVPKGSLQALVDAELVDLLPARMYRIRGLRNEREKRALAATRSPGRTPPAPQPGPASNPVGSLDETSNRRDETRQDARALPPAPVLSPAEKQRYERMERRRFEWFRQGGKWDPEWGPEPREVARGAA